MQVYVEKKKKQVKVVTASLEVEHCSFLLQSQGE